MDLPSRLPLTGAMVCEMRPRPRGVVEVVTALPCMYHFRSFNWWVLWGTRGRLQ